MSENYANQRELPQKTQSTGKTHNLNTNPCKSALPLVNFVHLVFFVVSSSEQITPTHLAGVDLLRSARGPPGQTAKIS
jgi:hypothetical protein